MRRPNYLLDKGLDPKQQLCTDDFAGHVAHNVNLSLKALLAGTAYAQLCAQQGLAAEARSIRSRAEAKAEQWLMMAGDIIS